MKTHRPRAASLPRLNGRFVYASLHAVMSTFIFGILVMLFTLFRAPLKWSEWASACWARWILWASAMQVELSGLENLPATPVVMVGNHQGMFDILVLMKHLPRPPVFVAKEELFRIPVFGPGMRAFGHIPVDRKNSEKAIASIQTGTQQLLKQQQQVIFFPEGTRTRDGKMLPFKKGAFVFALESGLPMVPFCVRGSYEALPPGVKIVRPGLIEVAFLAPIDPALYPSFATKEDFIQHVYALIENKLVEMEANFAERAAKK